jgi:hypothetical protein
MPSVRKTARYDILLAMEKKEDWPSPYFKLSYEVRDPKTGKTKVFKGKEAAEAMQRKIDQVKKVYAALEENHKKFPAKTKAKTIKPKAARKQVSKRAASK